MSVFWALLAKVAPQYVNLLLGFVAGKWLKVDRHSISTLMVYIIAPLTFFGGISRMELTPALMSVPFIGFAMAGMIAFPTFYLMRKLYSDNRPNIMATAAGNGNNGYFGLPIAMLLFDAQTVGIYLMLVVGTALFESSLGFYITAKGQHTARESLLKTLRLPTLYAMLLGYAVSLGHIPLPEAFYLDFQRHFQGAYAVLGMMIIGLGLSTMKRLEVDAAFTGILFFARFVVWPLLALSLVWADVHLLGMYGEAVHRAVVLVSIMPLAANSVAIASLLHCHPEKTATTVLLSTLFAVAYVPAMVWLLLQ